MPILPIVSFLVLAGFLAALGVLALAVTKVVAPDGRGHARGFAGGCASAIALVFLCGLGLAGLAASVAAIGIGSLVDWNPVRRIEVSRAGAPAAPSARPASSGNVSARITVRGDGGEALLDCLRDLVDVDLGRLEEHVTVHRRTDGEGTEFSVYEVRLPLSDAELARFERDLERELDGLRLRLPSHVDVEFR